MLIFFEKYIKLLRFIRVACTIQIPGLVNVDFADVRAIMANAGSSLMGIGTATGKTSNFFQVFKIFSICLIKFSGI